MYLRKVARVKDGKRHEYWALVESYRSERGPRQRIVAYLGEMDATGRLGVARASAGNPPRMPGWFDEVEPEWVQVDVQRVRVAQTVDFGGPWLGLELMRRLELDRFLKQHLTRGKEEVAWSVMAQLLILCRLCHPSSELHIAEHYFEHTALGELLGVPPALVNEARLYRALDQLLPHKEALERHLKERLGSLFALEYDLFLYDVTSTYFEGAAAGNALAQRGYSRDQRGDCKQVCIALVVTREGFPLGYEVFAGNRADVTTLAEIVKGMERRYGKANRIWVMDRGMASAENIEFLVEGGRRYIIGATRGQLKRYEKQIREGRWETVRAGLEVQMVDGPDSQEMFILCRSAERAAKDKAIHDRFEQRIEAALKQMVQSCSKRRYQAGVIERRLGRLLGRNSRAANLFEVEVKTETSGRTQVVWAKREQWRGWARLSEGCYLLRTNVRDWSAEDLWRAYTQLTEAEEAFRIEKSDLVLRPIWHQKEERVRAHILVCFLAYVLWKTLAGLCRQAGLGDEPRKVFAEIGRIQLNEVILPTHKGIDLRLHCVTTPTPHQAILLQRLHLPLPRRLEKTQNVVKTF